MVTQSIIATHAAFCWHITNGTKVWSPLVNSVMPMCFGTSWVQVSKSQNFTLPRSPHFMVGMQIFNELAKHHLTSLKIHTRILFLENISHKVCKICSDSFRPWAWVVSITSPLSPEITLKMFYVSLKLWSHNTYGYWAMSLRLHFLENPGVTAQFLS